MKPIAITPDAHARAKAKAKRAGMIFYRFVEMALDSFEPPARAGDSDRKRRATRIAG